MHVQYLIHEQLSSLANDVCVHHIAMFLTLFFFDKTAFFPLVTGRQGVKQRVPRDYVGQRQFHQK